MIARPRVSGAEAVKRVRIGTAGWAIPRVHAPAFPEEGSGLQRYAARLDAAEINSSFHRPHRTAIYARWADAVPAEFRFAVKLPKTISHERRLIGCDDLLARFAEEVAGLGRKRGPLLLQLPPSFAFDGAIAEAFFALCKASIGGSIVCEPRHASWFEAGAEALLARCEVARVAADPARVPAAAHPGGWRGLAYHRLHGSPRIYRSEYDAVQLKGQAAALRAAPAEAWTIYDNTASGAAIGNALGLKDILAAG